MDDNRLLLIPLADGLAVEAVAYPSGTLCLSSQAGCAVGCPFCASGSLGLLRNLQLEELWLQFEAARTAGFAPLRLTLSGIGEPLQNLGTVGAFLVTAARRGVPVSVTTCGAPLGALAELLTLPHNGVMVSLHAGSAATHRRLIPRGPDYEGLWSALTRWRDAASRRARRRLGFNYLLLDGINDGPDELEALAARLALFPEATLHLLRLNPVDGSPYASPSAARFAQIHAQLRRLGLNVRRGNRWRGQRRGGCGTLYLRRNHSAVHPLPGD